MGPQHASGKINGLMESLQHYSRELHLLQKQAPPQSKKLCTPLIWTVFSSSHFHHKQLKSFGNYRCIFKTSPMMKTPQIFGSQPGDQSTPRENFTNMLSTTYCHPVFKSICKSKCTNRIKFFAWLLLVDRLNTKTMLTRKHIFVHNDELCVMCNTGAAETINHLFFTCPFAR